MRCARALHVVLACTWLAGCSGQGDEISSDDGLSAGDASGSDATGVGPTGGPADDGTSGEPTSSEATTGGSTGGDTEDGGTAGTGTGAETGDETASGSEGSGGPPPSDDPFDPLACTGQGWTAADAAMRLNGVPREVLAHATIQVRSRMCPGGVCGAWGAGVDWEIHYLTYSGGVVTRWKDLPANMDLVLFDDGGAPRLSMQHESFGAGGYPDDDGVLYDFPPSAISYPHLRAYNEFPDEASDYIDLDYQVADGVLVLGAGCAVWTANPYGTGQPYTEQYGVLFRW